MAKPQESFEHRVYLGIGDAILRLIKVEMARSNGMYPTGIAAREIELIVQALNQQYQLDLGMDCNRDGVPDSIQAFTESAQTSCCRILPPSDGSPSRIESLPEPLEKASPKKKAAPKKKAPKAKAASKKAAPKRTSRTRTTTSRKPKTAKKSEGLLSNIFGKSKE